MTDPPVFLLDANVFMQAARQYYAFDLVPAFWQALLTHAAGGRVRSIDRVKGEVDKGNDDLKQWATDKFHSWFESTGTVAVLGVYPQIIAWAQGQAQFTEAAKAEFASVADGWLVAYAKTNGCIVVTLEKFDPLIKRKIPIPNVCRAFSVPNMDTFEMLRVLGVKLG